MESDPYWTEDRGIGRVGFDGEPYGLRVRLHESRERYTVSREPAPMARRGERVYLQARPYVVRPDIAVEITLRTPPAGAVVG